MISISVCSLAASSNPVVFQNAPRRWCLGGGLYIVFCSALLAGLGNVGFEPVCSGVLSVFRVVSGLPLLSALWGWSGVCAEVVGGAVVLWGLPLQLEEVLQESAASVGVVGCGW